MEEQIPPTPVPQKKITKGIKESIKKLPEKKPHLDFIAALLTIPLLVLTLYLNIANLKNKNSQPTPTPVVTQKTSTARQSYQPQNSVTSAATTTTPLPTATAACIKDIGPIDITSPQEGQIVSDNPVCIYINYQTGNYCSVVWAYKINHGPLSDYSNNSVCLYNLPSGNNTFELFVKSLVSTSTKSLQRNFVYKSGLQPTPTLQPSPTSTSSASAQ